MDTNDIFIKTREILSRNSGLSLEEIELDSTFESLELDSLDIITTVGDLEREFNVTIPDEKALEIKSIRDVVDELFEAIS